MDRPHVRPWPDPIHGIMGSGRPDLSGDHRLDLAGGGSISGDQGAAGPSTGLPGERAIVEAVLAGDREAFRRLVEREAPVVVRACYRILGDQGDAEDAAQEAFLTAYRSLGSWRGEGPFGAWLTRIAVRIALRMAGKRRTVAWRDPRTDDEAPSAADRAADRAAVDATAWTDPAVLSMRAERSTELRTAVAALPEPYREVVALRFFGDASLEEIARQTGRPLGTVKTHLRRGLARLRGSLDGGDER
jgi:RNA polymerase sigma-70 factor (ECF subfamily)